MCTIMSLVYFILRDIASAIKNLLDAVNSVFMYIDGQSNKQVHQTNLLPYMLIKGDHRKIGKSHFGHQTGINN